MKSHFEANTCNSGVAMQVVTAVQERSAACSDVDVHLPRAFARNANEFGSRRAESRGKFPVFAAAPRGLDFLRRQGPPHPGMNPG